MPQNRTLLMLIALACFGMIGAALYLQHYKDLLPCPLCVIQRYIFLVIGIVSLIAASAGKPKVWGGVAMLAALAGLATVGKHLYVLAHPGLSCGIDPMETFLNKIPTAVYLPWIFKADGLCEDARDTLLGLSVPQWSALGFAIVTAALLVTMVRRR